MADAIRRWDVYALEELGSSDMTMKLFQQTHDKDGNFYPNLGEWFDHCMLQDMHPFFAGTPMPVGEENLNQLYLVEQDVLIQTVRKYGKGWWKNKKEDYLLYKKFSKALQERINKIPVHEIRRYESGKRGLKLMDEVVSYHPFTRHFIASARVDWDQARKFFSEEIFESADFSDKRSGHTVKRFPLRKQLRKGASVEDSFLKKSERSYQSGPAAFLEAIGSRIDKILFGSISWGKDRFPGFGVDVWRMTHTPDGRPCPNIGEWFDWCRSSNVHPMVPGQDCRFTDAAFLLGFSRYERKEKTRALKLWKGHNADIVLMRSASAYDKKFPLPDGKKRQYGILHVNEYLEKENSLRFPDMSSRLDNDLDKIAMIHSRRRLGLVRFTDQIVRTAKRRAIMIVRDEDEKSSMEWNVRPNIRKYREGSLGL